MKNISKCVSLWIFVFGLDYTFARVVHSDDSYQDSVKPECVLFRDRDKLCKNVLYNQTTFPNRLGHVDLSEAVEEFKDFMPLIDVNCSDKLQQFLCFIYFPPCTMFEEPISVCRSYCEDAVTSKCREILDTFKKRPPVLECGKYPPLSENVLCIKPDNTISKNGGTVATATTSNGVYYDEFSYLDSKEGRLPILRKFLLEFEIPNHTSSRQIREVLPKGKLFSYKQVKYSNAVDRKGSFHFTRNFPYVSNFTLLYFTFLFTLARSSFRNRTEQIFY